MDNVSLTPWIQDQAQIGVFVNFENGKFVIGVRNLEREEFYTKDKFTFSALSHMIGIKSNDDKRKECYFIGCYTTVTSHFQALGIENESILQVLFENNV